MQQWQVEYHSKSYCFQPPPPPPKRSLLFGKQGAGANNRNKADTYADEIPVPARAFTAHHFNFR